MKKVILLFLLLPYMASAQIFDDFESGLSDSWVQSSPGRWSLDSVSAQSGKYSLHHSFDNPEAGIDSIGIPLLNLHPDEGVTSWSFVIRHGYDPSSSNNWGVFLFSDNNPSGISIDGNTKGFAIGVNLTGYDDTLRLWKIKGSILSTVVNCRINWQTEIGTVSPVKINIERDKNGRWDVSVYRMNGSLIRSSSGTDNELPAISWFGIYYKYSSTRDRLLWVDDVSVNGVFYSDTTPPSVTGIIISGKRSVEISIDEEPDSMFFTTENFSLSPDGISPISVIRKSESVFLLEFANEFINKTLNQLIIRSLCDKYNNCRKDILIEFTPVWAETGDIVISEIMADPLPAVGLPGKEYIELTNRSSFPLKLKSWKLYSGDQSVILPDFTINSSEIQILCYQQDTALFKEFGQVTGLKQFPSLTDYGKLLILTDTSGNLIHGLEYSDEWYYNELKSKGGWSLEMIDTSFPFYSEGNWTASVSRKGGTPGLINSVAKTNRDLTFRGIINVFPEGYKNISVLFSEPLPDYRIIEHCSIEGGPGIAEITSSDKLNREFRILLSDELERGKIYNIRFINETKDFAGNCMERSSYSFGLTEAPSTGDILFNELLFNPLPGDPDYIEFHNCSAKVIDASRLYLVYLNEEVSDTSELIPVSNERRCILPGEYFTITTDRQKIVERYLSSDKESIFSVSAMPSMPDDKGTLILYSSELDIIDKVTYNEKMHYSLLSGFEGIALEKTGRCSPSGESVSWHSATENSGWGTPGRANSVDVELQSETEMFVFSSTKITPDNDGFEDFLSIRFNATGNGNVVSVSVFDETGGFVRKIASNMLTGPEATFLWDGTADDGSPVISGIYIILINWFNGTGKTERVKKVCTVIR
jgi:hypothetical protein